MKWLISCFEPFNGAKTNSSQIVCEKLKAMSWDGQIQFTAPLPVTYSGSWPALKQAIEKSEVDGVLALGQAESRSNLSLECVALNWLDSATADNRGEVITCKPVLEGEPDVIWSNIPWSRIEADKSWSRSYSAGTFVCNGLMYHLCHWARSNGKQAGFLHLPLVDVQTDSVFEKSFKMPLDHAVQAMTKILEFLVQQK